MKGILCVTLSVVLLPLLIPDVARCEPAQEVKVVVHPDVPRSTLSRDEIQEIFLGRNTRWDQTDQKVRFIMLKGGEVHETFVRRYVGKTAAQFGNYWRKMVFTGKGRAPKSLGSPEKVVDYVANTAGAIGYVPQETDTTDVVEISVPSQ